MVPRPVLALLLLFPITEATEKAKQEGRYTSPAAVPQSFVLKFSFKRP